MTDAVLTETSDSTATEATSSKSQVESGENAPTMEDLKRLQSTKDREVAEAKREAAEAKRMVADLENKMSELISDPAARAEFDKKRMETELNFYRGQTELTKQKTFISNTWGIPVEVLDSAVNPAEMTRLALDWQAKQRETLSVQAQAQQKKADVQKLEDDGADEVSMTPGTPPSRSTATAQQLDKQIADLREIARQGGGAGTRARLEILKLEAQRQVGRSSRARI